MLLWGTGWGVLNHHWRQWVAHRYQYRTSILCELPVDYMIWAFGDFQGAARSCQEVVPALSVELCLVDYQWKSGMILILKEPVSLIVVVVNESDHSNLQKMWSIWVAIGCCLGQLLVYIIQYTRDEKPDCCWRECASLASSKDWVVGGMMIPRWS